MTAIIVAKLLCGYINQMANDIIAEAMRLLIIKRRWRTVLVTFYSPVWLQFSRELRLRRGERRGFVGFIEFIEFVEFIGLLEIASSPQLCWGSSQWQGELELLGLLGFVELFVFTEFAGLYMFNRRFLALFHDRFNIYCSWWFGWWSFGVNSLSFSS